MLNFKLIKRAEKEWGDGIRGLSMSAAQYALLKLEESPPHVKNWRPQLLLLTKCTRDATVDNDAHDDKLQDAYEIQHPKAFAFASQLKAGKGLFVCANVISGDFIEKVEDAKNCKKVFKKTMKKFKVKGFCDSLIAENIEQGLGHL